jgi:hypothetical protein
MLEPETVSKQPDLAGPHGRAWQVDLDALRKRFPQPSPDATLALWIVEAPWAHLAWHSYAVFLMHLRLLPGVGRTLLYVDGGTHEVHVYAMNPDVPREPIVLGQDARYFRAMLTPVNFAAQFIEESDATAYFRVKSTVRNICDGLLSPDTDHVRSWTALYGDNMMRDRDHAELRKPVEREG